LYLKTNWNATDLDIDTSDDHSPQRKYMITTYKKMYADNSTRKVQMILLRPKDFLDVITTSKCVTEYRRYFIAIAEIRRSYQETYLPWVIEYYKRSKLTLEQKVEELLANSRHIIVQNDNQSIEIKQLHVKLDTMFEYLLSFARMTIPTWIGSSVIKKQYDTLIQGKSESYALQHLKVLFMVGFYNPLEEHTTETKVVDGETITFIGKATMRVYSCCTNFADVRKRIKELYYKYTNGDTPMYMCKPLVITLISCEINLERIILENSNIFPEYSTVSWESKYKRYNITIAKQSFTDATNIFENICAKATTERFQGYQMRINEFNQSTDTKVDRRIVDYIDNVDAQFYASTKPFCQRYIDSYTIPRREGKQLIEYMYERPSAQGTKRSEYKNRSLTTPQYTLRKVQDLLIDSTKVDHIKSMTDHGILSKTDLPALKALAKFENIDVSELEPPSDYESE
jgi:hypothetical protein